jgi:predicted glycoside hydrolase/deacetylase ChbG (UPF0249 family)
MDYRDQRRAIMEYALIVILAFSFALSANGETLAEKLGHNPDDKLLILHADDVGMSHSANRAVIQAFDVGMVTCGSIMVPCPWFPEIAAYCREHPEADLGLHLTLTSEWKYYRWGPVASKDKVPSLLDAEGFLWRSTEQVREHAKPEEVEIELRAQIERALEFGVKPTHLDTHMGTVFVNPRTFEIYCQLGKEYGIPPMLPRLTPELMERVKEMGLDLSDDKIAMLEKLGFPFIDTLITGVGGGRTLEEKKASYYAALKELKPGVSQIILHLGMDDDEMRGIMNSHMARYNDYRIFTDPETRQLTDELGIKLIGWKPIKDSAFRQ